MRFATSALLALGIAGSPATPARAAGADPYVDVSANRIVAGNALFDRTWSRAPFRTVALVDRRSGRSWSQNSPDFAIAVAGLELPSDLFNVAGEPVVENGPNGLLRLRLTLTPALPAPVPPGLTITRIIEVYPGIAGLRAQTLVDSLLPLAVTGYTLDSARVPGTGLSATIRSFRAGADWREAEWAGPPLVVGDAAPGDWVTTTSGPAVAGTAQWLSVGDDAGGRLFMVMERNDFLSGVMGFDGRIARAGVDFSRDVIYLGPLEEQVHVGNPGSGPGRVRVTVPGVPLRLEPVFTGVGRDADDEAWQHYKFLANHRMPPYPRAVTFNSNGVDANRISTGAKDDMDFGEFRRQLRVARRLGVETFILDDGWQARSGDWCPDAVSDDEQCTEPRRGSDPKFAPRFPDPTFAAVRAELGPGMRLGLWMSPVHFHPESVTFRQHPEWTCLPVGAALLLLNQSDPYGSSNEAGIVQWNLGAPGVVEHVEGRIRRAIEAWGVRYFKFDFTAWLDCAGTGATDFYAYRETFMAMLDRIIADHPDVTLQMDETNDYRLFPFEAIARGPTWYQNGSPTPAEALHANHVLAPWVALHALGRNALRAHALAQDSTAYQMAVALLSHVTFFNDLRDIPASAVPEVRRWMRYYRRHRRHFTTIAYPLLDEDPITGDNWAAFQTWDPDRDRGALLVYRQDSPIATQRIRLRNLRDGTYTLLQAPDDTTSMQLTAAQLRAGLQVTIPGPRQAQVWRIQRLR